MSQLKIPRRWICTSNAKSPHAAVFYGFRMRTAEYGSSFGSVKYTVSTST
jgi:hypothetical protein